MRLSDERRDRVRHAFMHPVRAFINRHHVWVSILVAMAVIAVLVCILKGVRAWDTKLRQGDTVYTIDLRPRTNGVQHVQE